MSMSVIGQTDGMGRIAPETVQALAARYTFLTNAVPELEKTYAELLSQIHAANADYQAAVEQRSEILDEREARVKQKEQELGFLTLTLNEKEYTLRMSEEKLAQKKTALDLALDDLTQRAEQHATRETEVSEWSEEIEARNVALEAAQTALAQKVEKFEGYRATMETEIAQRIAVLASDQQQAREALEQYLPLRRDLEQKQKMYAGLQRDQVAFTESRDLQTSLLAEQKRTLDTRATALTAAEEQFSQKLEYLNSRELDLKALKLQLDKRESKIRELIVNNGAQVKDTIL